MTIFSSEQRAFDILLVEDNRADIILLKKAFEWARAAAPTQPLTVGLFRDFPELNAFQLTASDVLTFHNYNDAGSLTAGLLET